jgi:hypothetical protein
MTSEAVVWPPLILKLGKFFTSVVLNKKKTFPNTTLKPALLYQSIPVKNSRTQRLEQYFPARCPCRNPLNNNFLFRGTSTYKNKNKTKRRLVPHGDYSSIANCRTKILVIFCLLFDCHYTYIFIILYLFAINGHSCDQSRVFRTEY